ncbi:HlyD family efflux transporter periplasmic adaptor subunit [Novosphingobium sp. FSY-8]|uniref:HlyD family efflux transporter periplasmic adaptor subunit n=1 Tax=Novosphingobium ovatum TaxID=1908523 RepID=A0ABW9XBP1_9SPHN|nr:HlyD family secretion protein [Novosphingobium ovatum]NBC35959.1 HlyD family efflux transporter periplasmic adaptor subunit [Novosphingobium ovatum]
MAVGVKQIGAGVAALALVGAGAGYYRYATHGRYFESTNDATIQADSVAIAAKLAGYVKAVRVADNQDVHAGAALVDIDPVDYATRLSSAQADVVNARAAIGASDAAVAEAQAAVGVATAALTAAQADLDHASAEVRRYRPLVAAGAEPAEKLSGLTTAEQKARADVAAKGAALDQARLRVAALGAQTRQASAREQAAQVAERAATNDLNATHLTAPMAGRVASRAVRVGQFVQPGMRLLTLVPAGDVYVVANFKETQVGLMRPGQPVEITADALPGITFHGAIESVTPGTGANFSLIPPQNATGNFTKIVQRVPVRIRIQAGPQARRVLVPGLSLNVTVDTRAAKGELDAIARETERQAGAR